MSDWEIFEKTLHSIPHVNTASGWNIVDREPALAALARLRERQEKLERFLKAFDVVEGGVVDFNLHSDAVFELRAARQDLG